VARVAATAARKPRGRKRSYPDAARELAILAARAPEVPARLAAQIVAFVQKLRAAGGARGFGGGGAEARFGRPVAGGEGDRLRSVGR
jgi:hypothetical protein